MCHLPVLSHRRWALTTSVSSPQMKPHVIPNKDKVFTIPSLQLQGQTSDEISKLKANFSRFHYQFLALQAAHFTIHLQEEKWDPQRQQCSISGVAVLPVHVICGLVAQAILLYLCAFHTVDSLSSNFFPNHTAKMLLLVYP